MPAIRAATEFISLKNLTKKYLGKAIVDGVDLTIDEPGVVALIGPNGSGKTTLMRLLRGEEKPTSGSCRIFGEEPYNNRRVLERIYFSDEHDTYDFCSSLGKILIQHAEIEPSFSLEDARRMADNLRLDLKRHYGLLSKGMKSQFNIVVALAMHKEITILDEPTAGLDARSRDFLYRFVSETVNRYKNSLVLFCTHMLSEFFPHCTSVVIMRKARIVAYREADFFRNCMIRITGPHKSLALVLPKLTVWRNDSTTACGDYIVDRPEIRYWERQVLRNRNISMQIIPGYRACQIVGETECEETSNTESDPTSEIFC